MCHSDNFPGPRGADLICIHININLHRNWIRDECAQLLLLCIYNKLHCKCWQHFTKQRGRQNILWESKSKWSTIFLKMVPYIFPEILYGHRHGGMQLWGCRMATAFARMARQIWSSTERNGLWSVVGGALIFFRGGDKGSGISVPSSNFVSQHLLFYWSAWVPPLWDLYSKRKSFTYLMFLSSCWLTVCPLELAFMSQRWVPSLCWKRGWNTAADLRARQGKFGIPWYGKVSGAQ